MPPPTPQPSFELTRVSLVQGQAFEPTLKLIINVKLQSSGNNNGVSEMTLLGIKSKVNAGTSGDSGFEIGYAESLPYTHRLYGIGSEINVELHLRLSPYLLHKIEALRGGKDLYFQLEGWIYAFANVTRNNITAIELVNLVATGGNANRKYPRSEWIDDLNRTEFDKVELIEMPRVEFAQIPLTADVMRYLHDAEKAMKEGRWDDVLGECRKTINALYVGIDEWGDKLQLTKEEKDAIQNASGSNDKVNARRNLYFTKLVQNDEKGERLNRLRNSLHHYLSLDPHEPDHKGVHFTRDDAEFALRITMGFCANMLKQLEYHLSKNRR